jgi:putative transcriptional regulator
MFFGKAQFLVAMPSLKSPFFANAVILMAEHKNSGSLGFIINLPTGTKVNDALKLMNLDHAHALDVPILFGGPVQTDFFWVIHSPDFSADSTIKVHDQFYLSSAQDIMPVLNDSLCPEIFYAGVGYSGWGAQQLDREIEEGSWWLGDFDVNLLFDVELSERWNEAFKSLGADPEHLIDRSDPMDPTIN